MRRVLIAAPFPPPTTGQSLVTEMAAQVIGGEVEGIRLDTADRSSVWRRPWALPSRRVARWTGTLTELRRIVHEEDIDVAYVTPASSLLGLCRDVLVAAAIPRHVPIVAHVHVGDYGRLLAEPGWGRLARRLARRFRRLLVPSEYAARSIRRVLPAADVQVVPNTVRPGLWFTPAEIDEAWAERRGARPVVLFLSNMIPSKGYGVLAEAARSIERDVDLVFAGAWADEAERQRFERDVQRAGQPAVVPGAVDVEQTRALLRRASVFAFPSTYPHESLPLAVLEAKAAGCAVVAFRHAGVGEMVRDGVDGRLVEAGDVRAFAGALDAALADAETLGRAGAEHVRDAFGPERFRASLLEGVLDQARVSEPVRETG